MWFLSVRRRFEGWGVLFGEEIYRFLTNNNNNNNKEKKSIDLGRMKNPLGFGWSSVRLCLLFHFLQLNIFGAR